MASLTIRLRVDPATGKKDVIVDYESDSDALPQEHEEDHRRLVQKLIAAGVVSAEEMGKLIIEREQAAPVSGGDRQEERAALPTAKKA